MPSRGRLRYPLPKARKRKSSERVVLEEPGLRHGLIARLQERAHFHGIGPVDDEVELRPPVAGDAVRHRLDELVIAETPARGRDDQLRLDANRYLVTPATEKLDHELAHA